MAITLRCSGCGKKISVDEAFAGSICRCPYCKKMNYVVRGPGGIGVASRPDAPAGVRPEVPAGSRPETPQPPAAPIEPGAGDHVPTARPVKIQGIVTIILITVLLAMVGGGVLMVLKLAGRGGDPTDGAAHPDGAPGPPETQGMVGSLTIHAPVLYCLDVGEGGYDVASKIVRISLASFRPPCRFNLSVRPEGAGVNWLSRAWTVADASGSAAASQFLGRLKPSRGGAASALSEALDKAEKHEGDDRPRTIVLLTDVEPQEAELAEALKAADRAKAMGIRIATIGLTELGDQAVGLREIAERSGGKSDTYGLEKWRDWCREELRRPGW